MARYYRLQPAGLGCDHYSETSEGETADGLHVFEHLWQTVEPDGIRETYGDELVVIEAPGDWPTGDVEGVCVDPKVAKIVQRVSTKRWKQICEQVTGESYEEDWWWPEVTDDHEDDLIAALTHEDPQP